MVKSPFQNNNKIYSKIKPLYPLQNNYLQIFLVTILVGISLIIGYLTTIKKQKKPKNDLIEEFDSNTLTQRQLEIVNILEKENNNYTQSNLQKKLSLPKASLFRNLKGLEKKGIIRRERKGMTMLITLLKKRK